MERNFERSRLVESLKSDPKLEMFAKPGFCRMWVKETVSFLKTNFPDIKFSIKETEICEEHRHTFIVLFPDTDDPIICDGVGVNKSGPYFGLESKSPKLYLNSRNDVLNSTIDR